jgi:hypothetical protein
VLASFFFSLLLACDVRCCLCYLRVAIRYLWIKTQETC